MVDQKALLHLMVSLSSYASLSTGFATALSPLVNCRSLKKGRVLVEVGRKEQLVWFLHAGTVKEVTAIQEQGTERVSWFWFPSDFIFYYPGFFAREPSASRIELVEDSLVLEIAYRDFISLVEKFSEVPLLIEKIRSRYENQRVSHSASLTTLNAKQRYLKFYQAHKNIFNVVKHKDIASFLGIKNDGFRRYH
ncbi:cyclic nucleotide-binding domain-containing protein [Pedobacter sp. Du54]|uniref:Crp/Fnr family transcriptional regulator n=1 Tax=Pedobacter anseongensis TaxID=3133439 RepID=UPI0030A0DFAA